MGQLYRVDNEDSHLKNRTKKFYLEGIKLSQFENKLEKWPNWIQFKREIKLNSLLEGKRIQFDIEDINEWGKIDSVKSNDMSLSDVVFSVKRITMIIKDDIVDELEIEWRPLQTELGRSIIGLLDAGIDVDISMSFFEDQFSHFYIKTEKNVA
jgi:hypothetical protein